MSDDEGDRWGRDESEEEEEEEEPQKVEEKPAFKPKPAAPPPQPAQKTEAQLAMERRRNEALNAATDLDEHAKDMLRKNEDMRSAMGDEIAELRLKSERRKAERQAEESRMQQQRAEEEARRKAEEEERRRKKEEEEAKRRELRASKMAEFEKWKNPPKPNFVITKRDRGEELTGGAQEGGEPKKSAEQLEAEKKAILAQRIQPLPNIAGMDMASLISKASELHNTIFKLESDKYDLEQRFKKGQVDMVELAERARQMSKGGKGKGIRADTDSVDKMQERFGAPPKISLCSKYERRKDKRSYDERYECFTGPQYLYPVDKIQPEKQLIWGDNGPEYAEGGAPRPAPAAPAPEPEPEPVEQAAE